MTSVHAEAAGQCLSMRRVVPLDGIDLTPGMSHSEACAVLRSLDDLEGDEPLDRLLEQPQLRRAFIANFGFSIVTREELVILQSMLHGKRVLEVGAGSGYLSCLLSERGVDVTASDCGEWSRYAAPGALAYQRDHEGDSLTLMDRGFDVVVMAWPPINNPFACSVAKRLAAGQMLVHLGEGRGGCTGDHGFYAEIADESRWVRLDNMCQRLNAMHLRFDGVNDRWDVLMRL